MKIGIVSEYYYPSIGGVQDEAFYQNMWQRLRAGKTWRGEMVRDFKGNCFSSVICCTGCAHLEASSG